MFKRTSPPQTSPLFPYTTLFRSQREQVRSGADAGMAHVDLVRIGLHVSHELAKIVRRQIFLADDEIRVARQQRDRREVRSEEHTSELQSRRDFVCRLLLEKKKTSNPAYMASPPSSGIGLACACRPPG